MGPRPAGQPTRFGTPRGTSGRSSSATRTVSWCSSTKAGKARCCARQLPRQIGAGERLMEPPLLAIEGLHVAYSTREGDVPAVVDCSLHVQQGECVGLVGESGCGKTTVALAIMRYLGTNGRIVGGRILFKGRDLLQFSPRMLRQVRG